jgi:mRNA-degrading endonuclease RelE of RelBE toxin-antitoxin system
MIFIETPIFTKLITELLPDDIYKELQRTLLFRPDIGVIIKGSGGLRKVRWNLPNEGKRGSLRIIYYWDISDSIYMLLPYKKSKKEDLTKEQIKILGQLMKERLK